MNSLETQLSLLSESILSESTLIKLIGDTPSGFNLARYMHRVHRVADQADWRVADNDLSKIDWTIFGSSSNNLLLVKGSNGWAMIRPVKETFVTNFPYNRDEETDLQKRTVVYEYYWAYGNKKLSDEELSASEQDLESSRDKRYGKSDTNKNVYTRFPVVDKAPGIIKTRARSPKKIIEDLTNKLNKIEKVWIADRREDTSWWKKWRTDTFDQLMKKPVTPSVMNPKGTRRSDAIIKQIPAGYQGRAGREVVPPGASIEMAKINQRARDREEQLGDPTTGLEGWRYLIQNTEPLKDIVIRRATIGIKRKFRGQEDFSNIPLFNIMRRLASGTGDWQMFLDQPSLDSFKKRIMNPKSKKAQQNVNQIINHQNPNARAWFIDLLVKEIINRADAK